MIKLNLHIFHHLQKSQFYIYDHLLISMNDIL